MPVRSLAAELNAIQRQDAGQKIGFLLLMNHQRRMLNIHVENIDLLSCELIEPFFDADFLTLAYRIPVDQGIGHDFFNRWLSQFAPVILSTAWQCYPGHLPGPLPLPTHAQSQWKMWSQRLKRVQDRVLAHERPRQHGAHTGDGGR